MKKGIDKIIDSIQPVDFPKIAGDESILAEIKKEAHDYLVKNGFPNKKEEEYKYTLVTRVLDKQVESLKAMVSEEKVTVDSALPFSITDALTIKVVNGQIIEIPKILVDGLTISSLGSLDKETLNSVAQNFAKYSSNSGDSFSKLNDLLSNDGIFISVEKNAQIKEPIVIHQISQSTGQKISFPRLFVSVSKHAKVDITEVFENKSDADHITNHTFEAFVDEGAHLNYSKIQAELNGNTHIGSAFIEQLANSIFTANTITLSGDLVRNNMEIKIKGSNAEANMNGLYIPNKKNQIDNHTVVDHTEPHSNSNQLYKGIMTEEGTGVFNGKIFVRQKAQKTNAFQSNKNVVLSNDANIYTKPQLEIWADDVKCSHGCTSGKLDEEALFYLQARGLSKDDARSFLLIAFAQDTLQGIEHDELNEYLNAKIVEVLKTV